jgi:hypothetical protein
VIRVFHFEPADRESGSGAPVAAEATKRKVDVRTPVSLGDRTRRLRSHRSGAGPERVPSASPPRQPEAWARSNLG